MMFVYKISWSRARSSAKIERASARVPKLLSFEIINKIVNNTSLKGIKKFFHVNFVNFLLDLWNLDNLLGNSRLRFSRKIYHKTKVRRQKVNFTNFLKCVLLFTISPLKGQEITETSFEFLATDRVYRILE